MKRFRFLTTVLCLVAGLTVWIVYQVCFLTAEKERSDNSLSLKLVWCPQGSFQMGSPSSDTDAGDREKPQVLVTLTEGFWIGKYEVTQKEWKAVMETEPWKGSNLVKEGPTYPATYVDYDDALEFCRKLTETERSAGSLKASESYTLPTEAQWEYACRAGTTMKYSFGDDDAHLGEYGWYRDNAYARREKYAHPVGLKKANPWGLYDMHGNVREWCLDAYSSLPGGRDPFVSSDYRLNFMNRGGCWGYSASRARSANRETDRPSYQYANLGFRIALVTFAN